ncbi:hypothetical protein [Brucella anthropi]|uniref:hypothetical protein n=1 Tax=Brucella anthropi TaxID=529 RepID=UPI000F66D329|nr:hypothetical protein [Brucella anthropi]RRY03851.1 hypothetical protein EGJ58_22385 [Brucella anthropi]
MVSEDLLKKAVAAFNALSPEQQAEMLEEQRQSWVRGNVGLSRDERGMTSPVMPRPAPAATDTGLETVEHQYWHDQTQEWLPTGFPDRYRKDGFLVRELVTRSEAVELLAAEIRRERDLAAKQLSEVVDRMSDDYLALKAELDQAVGVIEDRSSEYEALEAKLAAAEKIAQEVLSLIAGDAGIPDRIRAKARAVLGGKPS